MTDTPAGAPGAIAFRKMHGAGNDFVLLDESAVDARVLARLVPAMCDRRRGIGADGVLRVAPTGAGAISVTYWNADGSDAFCGNGTRCAVAYAYERDWVGADAVVSTVAGPCRARVRDGRVSVSMPEPEGRRRLELPGSGWDGEIETVRVGVPHVVLVTADVGSVNLAELGPRVRRHAALGREGANVNVVRDAGPEGLELRTYERGVEAETLACGSGAAAAAICVRGGDGAPFTVPVRVASGDLLTVTRDHDGLWLEGPAVTSFVGSWTPEGA